MLVILNHKKKSHIISLMLLSTFVSIGAVIIMPALPDIAPFFKTSVSTTQLTVSSYLFAYAIGQLIYGPLANRFGRKITLYIGVVIATIGSIFSILSTHNASFLLLIFGRFFEALGSCTGIVICFTIINDFYSRDDARAITSIIIFAYTIIPGIAIAIGGEIVEYFNWAGCFYFLLIYGLFLFYIIHQLPETLQEKDLHAIKPKNIIQHYKTKFLNTKLIGYAMICGLSGGCIYVFGTEGPYIGVDLLKTSPSEYGLLAFTPYFGALLGGLIIVRFVKSNPNSLIKFAFSIEMFSTLIMLILFLLHKINLFTFFIPISIFCIGNPIITATTVSLSMEQDKDKANTSAVTNFVAVLMSFILTLLLGISQIKSAWIMPLIFLIALFLMCTIYFKILREQKILPG